MVRFAKPHISVIYTEQWRNMMVLNNQDFIIENLTVRFTIYVFSVIFKNSAAVTNTRPGGAGGESFSKKDCSGQPRYGTP